MVSPRERYAKFLAAKGRRFTCHAALVVDAALSLAGLFGADDILARVGGQVSRATVFRTLAGLAEAGLLRSAEIGGIIIEGVYLRGG